MVLFCCFIRRYKCLIQQIKLLNVKAPAGMSLPEMMEHAAFGIQNKEIL